MIAETLTRADLISRWATLGVEPEGLKLDIHGTLRAPSTLRKRPGHTQTTATPSDATEEVLGEGAMGVVVLTQQPELRRQVAVKRLKAGVASTANAEALRREARLVGNLEHPNIVAVHDLTGGPSGAAPQMVMKRIEGVTWSALLRDPTLARDYAGSSVDDLLTFHLRVLMRVCHALRFAHARSVLHLDVKPDNVMVGRYDEVYLVDWGIAAGFGPEAASRSWLTPTSEVRNVCGTPAYMAPEQVTGQGTTLGPYTDVFLLGAVLHEVVTGRRFHCGADVLATLVQAWVASPKVYGPEVPSELAALIARATARERADRLISVDEFLAGLTAFVAHRASTKLSDAADGQWRTAVEDGGSTVDRTLAECRFGYRQALSIWEDNDEARAGLQQLLLTLIDRALDDGRVDQARNYLGELVIPAPEVAARVATEEQAHVVAAHQAWTLERQMDERMFMGPRSLAAFLTGLTWLVANVGLGVMIRAEIVPAETGTLFGLAGGAFVAYLLGAVPFRKTLLRTKFNRIPILQLGAGILLSVVLWWMALIVGLDVYKTMTLSLIFYANYMLALAVAMDLRVAWCVLPIIGGAIFAVLYPTAVFDVVGCVGLVVGLILARLWRPRGKAVTLADWRRDE